MKEKSLSHRDRNTLNFGKYKGKSPEEIASIDPGYIVWLYANVPGNVSRTLFLACSDEVEEGKNIPTHINGHYYD